MVLSHITHFLRARRHLGVALIVACAAVTASVAETDWQNLAENVRLSPTVSGELSQDVTVASSDVVVTVSNDCPYVISGSWSGQDFSLVKEGTGPLTIKSTFNVGVSLSLKAGTLALTKSLTASNLTATSGAVLQLVADDDGALPLLTLGSNTELTDLTVKTRGASGAGVWKTLLKTTDGVDLTGLPSSNGALDFRLVTNGDGTMELQGRNACGFGIIVR